MPVSVLSEVQGQVMSSLLRASSIVGADGANTINKGRSIMYAVIAVISAIGGLFLVAVAIKGMVVALHGDTKDWSKFLIELAVGIFGGVLIAVAVGVTWSKFFSGMGQDFNVVK